MAKRYNKILAAFYSTPWAILAEKLEEVCAFIELKAHGHDVAESDVRAVMQTARAKSHRNVEPGSGTALIKVHGVVSHRMNAMSRISGGVSTELLTQSIDEVRSNNDIGRVILDIESPGGAVPGTQETARKIRQLSEEKEVITVYGGVGASAAFWLGSASGRRIAIPSSLDIGSLGVIFKHVHYEDKERVVTTLRSVEHKALIQGDSKMPAAAIDKMKRKIAAIHETFESNVAEFLGLSREHIREHFGKGETFMASEAKERGMVDDIATLEEVLQEPIHKPGTTRVSVNSTIQETEKVNAKIKLALIGASYGLLVSSSNDDFEAALALHREANDLKSDASDEEILATFDDKAKSVKSVKTVEYTGGEQGDVDGGKKTVTAKVSDQEITDIIACSAVPESERFSLCQDLQAKARAGEISSISEVSEAISKVQAGSSVPAGFTDTRVTADSRDKLATECAAMLVSREYGEGADNMPETITGGDGKEVKLSDVPLSNNLRSVPRMIETIMEKAHGPKVVSQFPSETDMVQAFFGDDIEQHGIRAADGPAFNTTGLFRNIVYNANNVIARQEYGTDEVDYLKWCPRGRDLSNFDKVEFKGIGMLSAPKAIGEDGEFSDVTYHGTESEEGRLAIWGSEYTYTWQLALSDDLSFLTGTQRKMVQGIRNKEDNVVHQYLASNPKMKDGQRLFIDGVNQLRYTGQVCYNEKIVKEAISMLYHQKDLGHDDAKDGDAESLRFKLRQIIQPLNLSVSAVKYFDSESPEGAAENSGRRNPHHGTVTKENRISVGMLDAEDGGHNFTWYGQDRRNAEWISWHNLRGFRRPRVRTFESRERLAMTIQVFKPFGCFAKGRRGAIRVVCDQQAGAGVSSPT